ncbi:hypothetical protein [uncultured Citricoccus sp.]|uniref:hypothetical protein n=1 Tax=uncultured Citricoccus sp. TaxID=614031 RepID=UPI00260898C5|nr:hypothetical protein [uncultured Citricoccus sp.]
MSDNTESLLSYISDDLHRIAQASERIADALERAHPKPREGARPGPLPLIRTGIKKTHRIATMKF